VRDISDFWAREIPNIACTIVIQILVDVLRVMQDPHGIEEPTKSLVEHAGLLLPSQGLTSGRNGIGGRDGCWIRKAIGQEAAS